MDDMLQRCPLLMKIICNTVLAACILHAGVVFVKLHGKRVDIHAVSWGPYVTACVHQARHEPSALPQPQNQAPLPGWQAPLSGGQACLA